jgi:hypothetical protein
MKQELVAVYGYCPECGAKGVARERRPDGNDKCVNGHTYQSCKATHPPQRTEPVGVMVSMDVSKGDEPEYRIFGRIYEVMKDGADEVTYLAIEDSRNFDSTSQRTWVGLTNEEIEEIKLKAGSNVFSAIMFTNDRLEELNK